MDVRVVRAGQADVTRAARVLAAALRGDAVMEALVPGDHDDAGRLTSVFASTVRAALVRGVVHLACDGDDVVGVAVWEHPGGGTGWAGTWAQAKEAPRLLAAVGLRHLPDALRAVQAFAAMRPRRPHWLLEYVAVAPSAHGRGVGSALLAHGLAEVDASGQPAYLEATTDASRRLYERFGFRAVGVVELRDAAATAMLREPVAHAS